MEMKKTWKQPEMEVLDVSLTMGGPNGLVPDKNGKGNNNRPTDPTDS